VLWCYFPGLFWSSCPPSPQGCCPTPSTGPDQAPPPLVLLDEPIFWLGESLFPFFFSTLVELFFFGDGEGLAHLPSTRIFRQRFFSSLSSLFLENTGFSSAGHFPPSLGSFAVPSIRMNIGEGMSLPFLSASFELQECHFFRPGPDKTSPLSTPPAPSSSACLSRARILFPRHFPFDCFLFFYLYSCLFLKVASTSLFKPTMTFLFWSPLSPFSNPRERTLKHLPGETKVPLSDPLIQIPPPCSRLSFIQPTVSILIPYSYDCLPPFV